MRVNPVDENGRRVLVRGFEPRERLTRHFIRILRPGDCVLDLGANMGYYALVAAELVGATGAVHAFEASPQVLPWLRANVALNPQSNIHVHEQAVTDRCGPIRFHAAAPARTGYSSIRDLRGDTAEVTVVPTVALDSLLKELPPVRLIKLDIEGAELQALRGMRALLARDKPFVISEMDDAFLRELGGTAAEMCEFLQTAGYDLSVIVEAGSLRPLTTAPTDRCNVFAWPL
jgi:FkbM family methyltransferase